MGYIVFNRYPFCEIFKPAISSHCSVKATEGISNHLTDPSGGPLYLNEKRFHKLIDVKYAFVSFTEATFQ